MRTTYLLAFGAAAMAAAGCSGSGEDDGFDVIETARAKARAAPRLVVREGDGQRILRLARRITAIEQDGSVLAWVRGGSGYLRRRGSDCYDRIEFDRATIAETRQTTVVPYDVDEAVADTDGASGLVHWQVNQEGDSPGIEGWLTVDRAGRPVRNRERTMRWGSKAPSRWYFRTYRFPDRLDPAPPRPRCRAPVSPE